MDSYLRITRHPYEEPYHLLLQWEVSNGNHATKFEIYVNASALSDLADGLEAFPRHATDVFLFEVGSERPEDRWAYYFRFRAFTTDGLGHTAVQLRFNNNQELPERAIAEFCISAEPARLNHLGRLFRQFAALQDDRLEWAPIEGTRES
jgi:hypothetical protein